MDNDTPSSSAAAVAMDLVDALRQSSSHFDDDELRRYIVASPQSQSGGDHSQQQQQQASMMGMNLSNAGSYTTATYGNSSSSSTHPSPANNTGQSHQQQSVPAHQATPLSSGGGALETALAALGDQGRQQLLAILQLAAAGGGGSGANNNNNANNASPAGNAPFATAAGPTSAQQHPSVPGYPQNILGQFSAQHSQGPSSSSSNSPSNGSGSHSSSNGGKNDSSNTTEAFLAAQIGALPNYYSNAFRQYSIHAPQQQQNIPTSGSQYGNNASTPNSASNSSAKPSPALSAITSHSQQHVPNNGGYGQQQQQQQQHNHIQQASQSHQQSQQHQQPQQQAVFNNNSQQQQAYNMPSSLPGNMSFTMPEANFFRSPGTFGGQGGIPGTSSTAFYSENGNPEDSDLLFTPLMSPALTASTQPGPSVGPLPESFANMTTQSQQKYSDHMNGIQGVAPMTVFSPLTSPALRPQGHSQAPSAPYTSNNVTSPPRSHGASNGSGKIRGASKNGPKTRPSPIIRPTIETDQSKQSNQTSGGKSLSRTSSMSSSAAARKAQQSQSAVPSPVSTSGFNSFPQPQYRQQSNSVPASPAFYNPNGNNNNNGTSSSSSNANKAFSNLNMTRLHENIAQTAVQNSPSPHQFDLSGVLPTFLNMQPPPTHGQSIDNGNGGHQASQNTASHVFGNSQSNANAPMTGLDDLMALPSPLDLNNILSMLSQGTSSYASPPDQQALGTSLTNGSIYPSNAMQNMPPPLPTGLAPFDSFLLKTYQQQQQQQLQSHSMPPPEMGTAQAYPSNNTQGITVPVSSVQKMAPLTPASFMNLPANQYSVLSGLLADHQHPPSQPTDVNQAKQAKDARKKSSKASAKQRDHTSQGSVQPPSPSSGYTALANNDQIMEPAQRYPPTSEEMQSSIALNATSPVSPDILAQNIKQVAAAAIAAKDAKSRSKMKGAARRQSSSIAQGQEAANENDSKKKAKKEQSSNGDIFASPDKPFSLDDGPSAAPSMNGGSGPASTETSPMLAPQADTRKSSHKVAEQRRRDSLKLCFEELRFILPPINPDEDEDFNGGPGSRRPGENNVGGQRGKNYTVDPQHPNKGISKVAMLRKSNEYVTKLHDRVDRRDAAIRMLREELRLCRVALGQGAPGDEAGLDALSNVDFDELEQDCDPVPPTYRLHGLHAPGSKLSLSAATLFYQPTERTIVEDDREDDDSNDEENGMDDGEYKAKKVKRASKSRVSTRNSKATAA